MASEDFRLSYHECRDALLRRLSEPAPGRIQLLSGPRQVGKTTLLLELVDHFGPLAVYGAADAPEAALPGFWERLFSQAEGAAALQGRAIVLLDEAQTNKDVPCQTLRAHPAASVSPSDGTARSPTGIGRLCLVSS